TERVIFGGGGPAGPRGGGRVSAFPAGRPRPASVPTRRTQRSDGPVVARMSARPGRPAPWRAAALGLLVIVLAMAVLAGSAAADAPGVDGAQTATSAADAPAATDTAPSDPAP